MNITSLPRSGGKEYFRGLAMGVVISIFTTLTSFGLAFDDLSLVIAGLAGFSLTMIAAITMGVKMMNRYIVDNDEL